MCNVTQVKNVNCMSGLATIPGIIPGILKVWRLPQVRGPTLHTHQLFLECLPGLSVKQAQLRMIWNRNCMGTVMRTWAFYTTSRGIVHRGKAHWVLFLFHLWCVCLCVCVCVVCVYKQRSTLLLSCLHIQVLLGISQLLLGYHSPDLAAQRMDDPSWGFLFIHTIHVHPTSSPLLLYTTSVVTLFCIFFFPTYSPLVLVYKHTSSMHACIHTEFLHFTQWAWIPFFLVCFYVRCIHTYGVKCEIQTGSQPPWI